MKETLLRSSAHRSCRPVELLLKKDALVHRRTTKMMMMTTRKMTRSLQLMLFR